jgi:hypothetical protein
MSTTEVEAATLEPVAGTVSSRFNLTGKGWLETAPAFSKAQTGLSGSGVNTGAIAMIDMGEVDLPAFAARITKRESLPNPSKSSHATEVASVLLHSCNANLHVYNVWDENGEDYGKLYDALDAVAASNARVLNLSIGSPVSDPGVAARIALCIGAGKIVVAAMGEGYPQPVYPAAFSDVIAVSAVDPFDNPIKDANSGLHAFIAAPGEGIRVVQDGLGSERRQDGSSYATAFVSVAVWLALRHVAHKQAAMRTLLKNSVKVPGKPHDWTTGFGSLDLVKLANNVGVVI